MKQGKRIEVFDRARAIAIMAVVAGHSYIFGVAEANFEEATIAIFIHQAVTFSVALFMYLIGYFLARTDLPVGTFWKRRTMRIIVPYLVWATMAATGEKMLNGGNWSDVITKVLTFTASGQHYFVFLVIVLYAIYPILKRMNPRLSKYIAIISIVASVAWVGIAEVVQWRVDINEISIVKGGLLTYMNPLCWIGFFFFGFWAGKNNVIVPLQKIAETWWYLILTFVLYFFAALEMVLFYGLKGYLVAFDLFKPLSILWELFSIPLVLAILSRIPDSRLGSWLSRYGRLSYGVFLSHLPMMWWIWDALKMSTGSYLLDRLIVNLIGIFLVYGLLEILHSFRITSSLFLGISKSIATKQSHK